MLQKNETREGYLREVSAAPLSQRDGKSGRTKDIRDERGKSAPNPAEQSAEKNQTNGQVGNREECSLPIRQAKTVPKIREGLSRGGEKVKKLKNSAKRTQGLP